MTTSPIGDLYLALGREAEDRVSLSYFNDTTEWTTRQVQVRFADDFARGLTEQHQNVYLMVNTVAPDAQFVNGRGDASLVNRLVALWADLDYKDGGLSPEKARNVIDMLSAIVNCEPAAIVHSGGGVQPYWALEDADITELNRKYMQNLLRRWGKLVQRLATIEGGKADSVYDLPRVLRAPGTLNFKYGTPVATSLSLSEWSRPLTVTEVEEALSSYGFAMSDDSDDDFQIISHPSTWEPAEVDCAWSQQLAAEIEAGTTGARHPWMLSKAYKIEVAARNGCITAETWTALVRLLDARFGELLATNTPPRIAAPREVESAMAFARGHVAAFNQSKMDSNLNYHTHKPYLKAVDLPKESTPSYVEEVGGELVLGGENPFQVQRELVPIALSTKSFDWTDAANGERLAQRVMGLYCFVPGLGWHVWEGNHYVLDNAGSIVRQAVASVKEYAETNPEGQAWARKSMAMPRLMAAIAIAESMPEVVALPIEFDAKPLELCTPGGIVDLSSARMRDATPGLDKHTHQTRFTPSKLPGTTKWDAFLKMVLTDKDRIDYLQLLCGVILIGEVRWHVLPVFVGVGANGKSTLLDIFLGVLGDYAAVMPENFLLDTGRLEHSTEIARLRGVRLAVASETRPDGKFNESRVKMLTGEQKLTGRAMRKDFMDFIATHTMLLILNHLPQVRSGGDSFWRRLRLLEFKYQVPDKLRNPHLAQEILAEEGPAVLAWMIEGALRVQREGLNEPYLVANATRLYRDEEDHINAFCTDKVDKSPEHAHTTVEIYGSYVAWCKSNGQIPLAQVALIRELRQRYPLEPTKLGRQRGWKGILVYVNED